MMVIQEDISNTRITDVLNEHQAHVLSAYEVQNQTCQQSRRQRREPWNYKYH